MPHSRAPRIALALSLAAGLSVVVSGCPGESGSEASSLLFSEAFMRQPEVIKSFMRASLASAIAQADLTKEQAQALAKVARERGPAVREAVDREMAPLREAAAKVDEATRQALLKPGEVGSLDEVMTSLMGDENNEAMMRLQSLMTGQGSDENAKLFDDFAKDIDPVLKTMSDEQMAKLANVLEGVKTALQYPSMAMAMGEAVTSAEGPVTPGPAVPEAPTVEEKTVVPEEAAEGAGEEPKGEDWEMSQDFEAGNPGELDIATRAEAVMKALGYKEPSAEKELFARAQAIVEEFAGTPEPEQYTAVEEMAKRIVDEVGAAPEMVSSRVRSQLVAIVGCEAAPELLDIVASRE